MTMPLCQHSMEYELTVLPWTAYTPYAKLRICNANGPAAGATLNFGKTFSQLLGVRSRHPFPVPFPESISISRWDFRFDRNMAGRGTPLQLRLMCPHIKGALPTTHHLSETHSTHLFAFGLAIGFHPSSAQVADSRIPKAQRLSGSLVYELA